MRIRYFWAVALCLVTFVPASAQDAGIEFFEKKIRPVLIEHCYECHAGTSKKVRGGLLLDSRAGVRKGGFGVAERRKWWSLQPVKKPAAPTPANAKWSADPIDRFLLSALEAKGLTPAQDADPRTLIRRLSLVLTGLPPTVQEVEDFAKAWDAAGATPQAALEKLVDRLLASPHFGERWARHWMDVVRFTETHGNEWNYDVHHAWRYRDYLIRAFNDDVPYDQLVREHIAGDLLKPRLSPPSPPRGRGEEYLLDLPISMSIDENAGPVKKRRCRIPAVAAERLCISGHDLDPGHVTTPSAWDWKATEAPRPALPPA
ncbi:MAG: DUF1549 domain-containing protein [Planctomycetes bacterium]|nr:DUF1549 domain-containing protein [Planctomycetota bacterium]